MSELDGEGYSSLPLKRGDGQEVEVGRSCLGMTRRTLIKGFGATLAAIAAPRYAFATDKRSRVAVVRKKDIGEMTLKAIHLAGGLDEIQEGETVVIKPNLVTSSDVLGNRVTTHPEVLRAVIWAVKERTAAENIAVGERSAFFLSTLDVAEATGILQVCVDEGVDFLPLEGGELRQLHASVLFALPDPDSDTGSSGFLRSLHQCPNLQEPSSLHCGQSQGCRLGFLCPAVSAAPRRLRSVLRAVYPVYEELRRSHAV